MIMAYNTEQSMEEGKKIEQNGIVIARADERKVKFFCVLFFVLLHASLLFFVHRLSVSNMVCIK